MIDTSLYLPRLLSIYSKRSSRLWFSILSSVLEIFRVTKRLANSSVRTVMGERIIAKGFSVTCNLTCKGLPSGIQKIVVIKCSPRRESGVNLQRMSALRCVLLSPGRFKVISNGSTQLDVNYSNRLVHAHRLYCRRFREETFDECKICRFWGTKKSSFSSSLKLFRVGFVTFSCHIVG